MAAASHNREQFVTVNFWAGARAAVGRPTEDFAIEPGMNVADLINAIARDHADAPRLPALLDCCSYLLGDRPIGREAWARTELSPGDVLEVLPPFAGG
jgi:molybdopterin converting factor small subunit